MTKAKKSKRTKPAKSASLPTAPAFPPELLETAELLDRESEEEQIANKPVFGVDNSEPEFELGNRLQAAREAARLTQGELSERTRLADRQGDGLSRAVISLYERGVNKPGPHEIRLLCEVLRITPSYLIYGSDDPFDNLSELGRYGGWGRSGPEYLAAVAYCFSRLHHHHSIAIMQLMVGLLRGWHKNFDNELRQHADDDFLKIADELRLLLAKRQKTTTK